MILVQQLATGHTQKSNIYHQIRIRIRFLVSVLWYFHLRGAHPLLQIHIYCTVNYCTKSLSLAKNHAHQSQTSSPVTAIAKRKRSWSFGLTTILNLMKLLSECTILIKLFKASFNNPQSKMYMKYLINLLMYYTTTWSVLLHMTVHLWLHQHLEKSFVSDQSYSVQII